MTKKQKKHLYFPVSAVSPTPSNQKIKGHLPELLPLHGLSSHSAGSPPKSLSKPFAKVQGLVCAHLHCCYYRLLASLDSRSQIHNYAKKKTVKITYLRQIIVYPFIGVQQTVEIRGFQYQQPLGFQGVQTSFNYNSYCCWAEQDFLWTKCSTASKKYVLTMATFQYTDGFPDTQ